MGRDEEISLLNRGQINKTSVATAKAISLPAISTLSMEEKRTLKQNNALHLYFDLVAKELNDAGLDVRRTLKPSVDIWWSGEMVKELMWKPIQKLYLKKKSTKELNKVKDIDEIYEIMNRHLSEKFGSMGVNHIGFPSLEELEKQL